MLAEAGIHTFFNGPESFTPDDRYLLGEAPECRGFWVAAGFNSIGIQSAGGAGMALAANLDLARRVLTPSLPIRPAMVLVSTSLRSDLGRLVLANSITLTPGTLTDEALLSDSRDNLVAAMFADGEGIGLAWLDLGGGRFRLTEVADGDIVVHDGRSFGD